MTTQAQQCTCLVLGIFRGDAPECVCNHATDQSDHRTGTPVLMTGPEVAAVLGVTRQAVAYNIRAGNYVPDYVTASGMALFRAARVTLSGVMPR